MSETQNQGRHLMIKRGRKKGSKNKSLEAPKNLGFWKITLKRPEEVNAFLERGSEQQKTTIKEILIYLKRADIDFFEKVNGEEILKELR
jgi:hypothetical protein